MSRLQTYRDFWPYYLSQHAHPSTRRLHTMGALIGLGIVAAAVWTGSWRLALLAPVVGYSFAWFSHFAIEHNRPATWDYPLWSLISEFRLAAQVLTGRL